MLIDNKMYRVPQINFNSKPFNGESFDAQVIKRAEMWRGSQQNEEAKSVREENAQAELKRGKDYSESKPTHFISIPISLDSLSVQKSFQGFRETLLSDERLEACSQN